MEKRIQLHDVALLTLKRWNLPQTKSVLSEQDENGYGEYISFQSHHFIDILPVEEASIPAAYSQISEFRLRQQKDTQKDVHIVQSMTILGRDRGFWGEKPDRLYATFLQLGNGAEWDFDQMEKTIGQVIRTCAKGSKEKPQWALYYALDFCDLVLFTKNLNLRAYHNVLWHLALVRGGILNGIRDTFTMYSFHRDYLKAAFQGIDDHQPVVWNEKMALSVNLSIQSMSKWDDLREKLNEAGISYRACRTSGRYDLNLITPSISGTKVLKLLRCIDKLCEGDKDTVFGGYEVQFLASTWTSKGKIPHDATNDRSFENAANALMDHLCQSYSDTHTACADYAEETCRSLKALLKNGFSEEFVLSVFVSFSAFLRTSLLLEQQQKSKQTVKQLERMNREYFSALNTLALCTMHNERQFIQAPSFNASYFDVPPKLLAFYSAVVHNVVETLWDGQEAKYRFVIAPDYKQDIYVSPLVIDEMDQTEDRLAVIRLCEQYFYDPANALMLLCHEIGHYMSDRKRSVRTTGIFYIVGLSILARTPLIEVIEDSGTIKSGVSLLHILTMGLRDFLLEEFQRCFSPDTHGRNQHHLVNVSEFLKKCNFGVDYFTRQNACERIIAQWQKALRQAYTSGNLSAEELDKALNSIESTLDTGYITHAYADSQAGDAQDARMQVFSILARNILFQVKIFCSHIVNVRKHNKFCDNLIQAYSEAYADMRMAQVMGNRFSVRMYEDLLEAIGDKNMCNIRHDALCITVVSQKTWVPWTEDCGNKSENILQETAIHFVHQYLSQCYEPSNVSRLVEDSLSAFQNSDIGAQINVIHDSIHGFRDALTVYCKSALSSGF